MMASFFSSLFLSVILLEGVSGEQLSARAHVDANNVRVGDPMILKIDFIGSADFAALHPPALAREVDQTVWKVDDASAKTDTYQTARRLIYRVRPMKEGLHEFPALSFSYDHVSQTGKVVVSTRPIPVHVKPGTQVVLVGLETDEDNTLMPDGITLAPSRAMNEETRFRWEKACRAPTAQAFAVFDFPEARLNEAACHILEGNWAKAIRLYSILEWQMGQTPTIERGLLAALARKHSTAAVELPVWRTVLRPVLRFAWLGRLLVLLGVCAALALFFWLCHRLIRVFVALAVFFLVPAVQAQGGMSIFEEMDRMHQQMMNQMNSMMNMNSSLSINGVQQEPLQISASMTVDQKDIHVGETFHVILSVEGPKNTTLEQIQLEVPRPYVFLGKQVGKAENLTDGKASNPSNRVVRMSFPLRYDVPFKGALAFRVRGSAMGRQEVGSGRQRHVFQFSRSFGVTTDSILLDVKPLASVGQPADFSGAVGTKFSLRQSVNRTRVETNDVIVVTHVLSYDGYVPLDAIDDVLERTNDRVMWQTYFVARGEPRVPADEFVYYDTDTKTYERLTAKGTALTYVADVDNKPAETVSVNEPRATQATRILKLRFAPSHASPILAACPAPATRPIPLETSGAWSRVDLGSAIGWLLTADLLSD